MSDMLVKLYDLPDISAETRLLSQSNIEIRRPMAYEKKLLISWIEKNFSAGWASECEVAFSHLPVTCFIAIHNQQIIGFSSYECTRKNFFGPMGVLDEFQRKGVGKALLIKSLSAMHEMGYAYAIIGGVGSVEFYEKTVHAIPIQNSDPGDYPDSLKQL